MSVYYKGLVGSHLYGSGLDTSDIDYFVIADSRPERIEGVDIFCTSPQKFVQRMFDIVIPDYPKQMQHLFSKPVIETEFSEYLLSNREDLIRSNLPRCDKILFSYAQRVSSGNFTHLMRTIPWNKAMINALRCMNEYINYAKNDISYKEAMKQSDDILEFIKGIKMGTVSPKEQLNMLNSMMHESWTYRDFYNKEPDLFTFKRIKSEMKSILDLV